MFAHNTLIRHATLCITSALCLFISAGSTHPAFAQAAPSVEASRLNNVGVALMNQQFSEKALAKFEAAHAADAQTAIPVLNKGIALLYLQKLPEAEAALEEAAKIDGKNPRVWYALGLAHLNAGNPKQAIDDLQHVVALDPKDADTHYFLGSFYLSLSDYEHAKQEYETAIQLNPIHASAQFGLARALQRLGDTDGSRQHLRRFQQLTQGKISSPLSAAYGEQGHYATVEDMLAPPVMPGPMIPVTLKPETIAPALTSATSGHSAGACLLPTKKSGKANLLVLGTGAQALRVFTPSANGYTEIPSTRTGLTAGGDATACAVGDYDGDGLPDLAVAFTDRVVLYHNTGDGHFEDATEKAGIQQLNHPAGLLFVDFDHDGDVDLLVTGTARDNNGPSILWRNNGNSTFTEWTAPTGLAGAKPTAGATLSDINNDRAVDLLVAGKDAAPIAYLNQREGKFQPQPLYSDSTLTASRGLAVFDFDKDGWMDVAVSHTGAPGITVWHNIGGNTFERVPLPLKDATAAWGLTPIDIDNDGWIDLAAIVETPAGASLRVFRNRGPQGFEDVSDAVGASKLNLSNPRALIADDIDGDGATDLIVTQADGSVVALKNIGGNKNHSLRIDLTGLADNKTAIGTKVEVFSSGQMQKFEITGGAGYLSQGATAILAGLGQSTQADVVRMLWPTGVPQDEIDISAVKPLELKELDRRGSSCPVLFAWDGTKYQFISDVIGAAVVGHWVSPTATNQADADEWIKVEGSQLKARGGYLSLRFGEPMEEINYIDQLRLVAVDHPEGTEVYPDERFLDEAPFASGKAVAASSQTRLPAGAWDDHGQDVLPLLAKRDHQYVRDFTNLSYAGYANMHTLTLDLGAWSPVNPLRLFLHGYIEYFSASSMYSAWQAGLKPISPYLEAQMPDGSWKRIIDDMGFPAGLPRTIVVDLTGKLPAGVTKVRLTTNLQIYWDQALVDNGPSQHVTMRQTELPLGTAHLAFRGYPQQIEGKTLGDLTYNYEKISQTGPFEWQRGPYTHYGNVTPLLTSADNQYVIFGSGEEIDAEFAAASLPLLPPHWKRDYFFYANGFVKDMDFYEAMPFSVAQLPYHEESSYPYPKSEHYPDTPETLRYLLNWDDRFEFGNRLQHFQFDYAPVKSEPNTQP
ncbi:FG-GAP-like repeat-containing protein [Silvibacterium sp.]|uniref:FG-GAP-like repeat-containing protein n=1 Tax=Silvibacterium sp. TaxID=1964179 RepID=UPI0039E33C8B